MNGVDACNFGLTLISAGRIGSLGMPIGTSVVSDISNMLYPITRDTLLAKVDWSFASRYVRLTTVTPGQFPLPNECLCIRQVGGNKRSWRVEGHQLYTHGETCDVRYTARVEEFPAYFCTALGYLLAAEFCLPLSTQMDRATITALASQAILDAAEIDANQDNSYKPPDDTYHEHTFITGNTDLRDRLSHRYGVFEP